MLSLLHGILVVAAWMQSGTAPTIQGVQIFPANNVWNTPVDTLPASRAIDIINDHGGHNWHPDFGTVYDQRFNGIPVNVVAGSTVAPRRVNVGLYASESDALPGGTQTTGFLPIPDNVKIEGDPASAPTWNANDDLHLLLIDSETNTLHELYNAIRQPDGSINAKQYSRWNLNSNALRTDFLTSTDASGLPVVPGLILYDQVAACLAVDPQGLTCTLGHALRFTLELTHGPHIWPARHDANSGDVQHPPFGMRVRLKANVDLSGYSPTNRIILNTLKKYGGLLADNGGDWFFGGAPDPRWNDDDLHLLSQIIPYQHMEVVDTRNWIVDADSGEANPNGSGPPVVTWPKPGNVLALDFNDVSSPVTAPGFTGFTLAQYTPFTGRGWGESTSGMGTRIRTSSTDPLWNDFVTTEVSSARTFLVDLPNGNYAVTLFLGDNDYPNNGGLAVSAEGALQFTLPTGTAEGQRLVRTFPVSLTDGQLTLSFGPVSNSLAVAGLEIDPVGAEPPPPPPPQQDPCVVSPMRVPTGLRWPTSRTGNRTLTWNSSTTIIVGIDYRWPIGGNQSARFTDERNCSITVTR